MERPCFNLFFDQFKTQNNEQNNHYKQNQISKQQVTNHNQPYFIIKENRQVYQLQVQCLLWSQTSGIILRHPLNIQLSINQLPTVLDSRIQNLFNMTSIQNLFDMTSIQNLFDMGRFQPFILKITYLTNKHTPKYSNLTRTIIYVAIILIAVMHKSECGSIAPTTVIQDLPYFGSHYMKLSSSDLNSMPDFGTIPKTYGRPLNKIYFKIKSSTIILSSYRCESNGLFGFKIDVSITTEPTTAVDVTLTPTLSSKFSVIGVSVIVICAPFDTVITFYEFDMDIQNQWSVQSYTRPSLYFIYAFVRSMSQRIQCVFDVWLYMQTTSLTQLKLKYTTYCTLDSNSTPDDQNVQAVIILLDKTKMGTTPQLNFLSYNYYKIPYYVFSSYTQFNIDIAKYGRDIDKKCILGFPNFDDIRQIQPYFLFDLDPLIGPINEMQNSVGDDGEFHSLCFQDELCPPEYPFKKLNDYTKCWECTGGVDIKQNQIPNCNTHDNSFTSIKYDQLNGAILRHCLKCTQCQDHYYADNGQCKECVTMFANCVTCQEKVKCLSCAVGYSLDSLDTCLPCNTWLANCQECTGYSICTKCFTGYFLDGILCASCQDKMNYCNSCSSATKCLGCKYPFALNSDQTACICEKGKMLTGTCSEVAGCISSHIINSATLCYACDTQKNWKFIAPYSCNCQKGYSKFSDTYCKVACGDGLWTQQQCDDGNGFNGDGCSSICTKQESFECTNIYLQRSICRYMPHINTQVYSLSRWLGKSQLSLKISFSPFHPIIMTNNWPSNILINSSKISFDFHEFKDNHLLVLHYTIQESVQDQFIKWTYSYDSQKFFSPSTSHSLLMKGMNAPLTYEAYFLHQKIIEIASYVIGGLAFVIAVVAMVKADSNIAFQTITTVLFVFYGRILLHEDNPAMLFALSGLRIAEGFNEFFPDQHRDYLQYASKNRFYIKSELSLMSLFTLSFMALILLLKVAFQMKSFFNLIGSKKLSIKKTMDSQTKEWKMFKFFNKAYNAYLSLQKNCFTPVTIILLYRILCAFNSFQDASDRYPLNFSPTVRTIITLIFFVVIIYYLSVGAAIVSALLKKLSPVETNTDDSEINLSKQQRTNLYADLYVLYLFATAVLIFFMMDYKTDNQNIDVAIEGCAGVIVFYTVFILVYRPYEKAFSMIAVVMNEVFKLGFLVFLFLIEKGITSDLWIMIGTYITLSLLLIIQIISVLRIKISWTQQKYIQNQVQELKQAFKLNRKDNQLKQQRLHNQSKQAKRKKKMWINYEENMYLYENIAKKEKQLQSQQKQKKASTNLYEALWKGNGGKKNTALGNQETSLQNNKPSGQVEKVTHSGSLLELSSLEQQKKESRSQLQKIKKRIRQTGFRRAMQ